MRSRVRSRSVGVQSLGASLRSPSLQFSSSSLTMMRRDRLRDNLGIIDHPREAGELADEVPDTGGVYFVTVRSHSLPHSNIDVRNEELMVEMGFAQGFGGLFAPYWDIRAT